MNDEAKKLIQEQYSRLPVELQKAIQSADLHKNIEEIGKKNQLHLDQVGNLEDETIMLMMGFTDPDEFASRLEKELPVERLKSIGIANDVGEHIMTPIRESMQQIMEKEQGQPQIPPSAPEKSVIMPSSKVVPPHAPITTPAPKAPLPVVADMHQADVMLTETTVTMAPPPSAPASEVKKETAPAASSDKTVVPKPGPYKADPYREPLE